MPTDLPALRAALFAALAKADGFETEQLEPDDYEVQIAAVVPIVLAERAGRDALVRAAALTEAEAAIRTTELPEDYIDLFDNGADWAADLVHDLAATAPTSQEK